MPKGKTSQSKKRKKALTKKQPAPAPAAAKSEREELQTELTALSNEALEAELRKRGRTARPFRVEKGKKVGVVCVWPSTRSRFPLAASAETWVEILKPENRNLILEFIHEAGRA